MKGDLHCHTKLSDGSQGIDEVILSAKRHNIDFLAITDHDTMDSIHRSKVLGDRFGVEIIPAVELSGFDYQRNRRVHILCYLPQKPDRLIQICHKISDRRKIAGNKMVELVMEKYPISFENVSKYTSSSTSVFKQHIMRGLMDEGYSASVFGELYTELFDNEQGSCMVDFKHEDVYNILEIIKSAGGIAVMAHPETYDSFDILNELIEKNLLDGIEVWHYKNSLKTQKKLLALTKKHHLIPTGGSDFHGSHAQRALHLGCNTTPKESIDKLFALSNKLKEKANH